MPGTHRNGPFSGLGVGGDIQAHDVYSQFRHAFVERNWVLGKRYWPRHNIVHEEGIIGSMTTTSMTPTTNFGWPTNRWNGWIVPDTYYPRFFDLIIYADAYNQPWKVQRAFITGNSPTTINFQNIGLIAGDLGQYIGKRFAIVEQRGLWWHDRIPPWPNPSTFVRSFSTEWLTDGLVTGFTTGPNTLTLTLGTLPTSPLGVTWEILNGGTVQYSGSTTATTTQITYVDVATSVADLNKVVRYKWNSSAVLLDDNAKYGDSDWVVNQFAGKKLAVNINGQARFGDISSNTERTLTVSGVSLPVGASYAIFDPATDLYYMFNKESADQWRWTGSPMAFAYGHSMNDGPYPAPYGMLETVTWQHTPILGGPFETTEDILDIDLWNQDTSFEDSVIQIPSPDTGRQGADVCFTPYFFYAWRGWQAWVEGLCNNFVPPVSHNGKKNIPLFAPATLFEFMGINTSYGAVVGVYGDLSVGGERYVEFSLPTLPYKPISVHYAIMWEDQVLQAGEVQVSVGQTIAVVPTQALPEIIGSSVVVSWGWNRRAPLEFKHFYDRDWFFPDPDTGIGLTPQDPPTSDAPGAWRTRPKSTVRRTTTYLGYTHDDVGEAFESGKNYRFVGDAFGDPSLAEYSFSGPTSPFMIYDDRGKFDGLYFHKDMPSTVGSATEGAGWYLKDTTATNWSFFGTMATYSAAVTSAGTTYIVDSTKAADGIWKAVTGRWVDFIVRVWNGSQEAKVPITGFINESTAPRLQFRDVGFTPTHYEIIEPANIRNYWKDRQLKVTRGGTLVGTVTITHSDADTLFFDAGTITVQAGDAYEIIHAKHGYIYRWNGSAWVTPPGWTEEDQKWGRPDIITQYGRAMKGDYVTKTMIDQLALAINSLVWTLGSVTWRSYFDPDFPDELNHKEAIFFGIEDCPSLRAGADAAWTAADPTSFPGPGLVPTAQTNINFNVDATHNAGADSTYAYAVMQETLSVGGMARTFEAWARAEKTTNDLDDPVGGHRTIATFDSGTTGLTENSWNLLTGGSGGPTTEPEVVKKIGSTDKLSWPPCPQHLDATYFATQSRIRGFRVTDARCIIKWNVTGGLTFI